MFNEWLSFCWSFSLGPTVVCVPRLRPDVGWFRFAFGEPRKGLGYARTVRLELTWSPPGATLRLGGQTLSICHAQVYLVTRDGRGWSLVQSYTIKENQVWKRIRCAPSTECVTLVGERELVAVVKGSSSGCFNGSSAQKLHSVRCCRHCSIRMDRSHCHLAQGLLLLH